MKWSFTKSRMFLKCPRKWYFSQIMASPTSKDSMRREAYLLKQLQSLHAWRGSLVDTVIEKLIVPRMKSKNLPSEEDVITFSMNLMDRQLKFGKERKFRCQNVTKSSVGDEYCALYDLEYNGGLEEKPLQEAREDVIVSLRNLMRSDFLKETMKNSLYSIAQRSVTFQFEDTTISCTPDLVTFFQDNPPLITDWKVHTFANADYWLQLGVYALALSRTKPHKDFPDGVESRLKDPTTFRLVEYQLLKNRQREYSISPEDVTDIYDYIFRSCMQMNSLVNGKKYDELNLNQFQTARSPGICQKCKFKKLCWRKTPVQRSLFEVPWT